MSAATGVPLYERTAALAILDGIVSEMEGEWTPEMDALMAEALGDFEDKAEAVAAKIRELLAFATAAATEAARMAAIAKAAQAKVDSLTRYLLVNMQRAGIPTIATPRFKISVRENPWKVEAITRIASALESAELESCVTVTPEQTIPESRAWDKSALIALHKTQPAIVAAVALITRGSRLEVR